MFYTVDDFAITAKTQVRLNGEVIMNCDLSAEPGSIAYPMLDQVTLAATSSITLEDGVSRTVGLFRSNINPDLDYTPVACIRTKSDILVRATVGDLASRPTSTVLELPLSEPQMQTINKIAIDQAMLAAVQSGEIHEHTREIKIRGAINQLCMLNTATIKLALQSMICLPRVDVRFDIVYPAQVEVTVSADYATLVAATSVDLFDNVKQVGLETLLITVDVANWTHFKHGDLESLAAHLKNIWCEKAPNAAIEVRRPKDHTVKEIASTWSLRGDFVTQIANGASFLDGRVKTIRLTLTCGSGPIKPQRNEILLTEEEQSSILSGLLGRPISVEIIMKEVEEATRQTAATSWKNELIVPIGGDAFYSLSQVPVTRTIIKEDIRVVQLITADTKMSTQANMQYAQALQKSFPAFVVTYTTRVVDV